MKSALVGQSPMLPACAYLYRVSHYLDTGLRLAPYG